MTTRSTLDLQEYLVESLEARQLMAAGDLDSTFGVGGKLTSSVFGLQGEIDCMVMQSNGRLLLAGTDTLEASGRLVLARYNSTGTLDKTFGVSGKTLISVGGPATADGAAFQTTGKAVVAADYWNTQDEEHLVLLRLTTAGKLDTTFGVKGKAATDLRGDSGGHDRIGIQQGDGKIVVVGKSTSGKTTVERFTAAGKLDTTFGTAGRLVLTGAAAGAQSLTFTTNGSALLVSTSGSDFAVTRLTTSGKIDKTFGTGGTAKITMGSDANPREVLVVPGSGAIVVLGSITTAGGDEVQALARFKSTGTVDTTFARRGKYISNIFAAHGAGTHELTRQSDNKLIFVGLSADRQAGAPTDIVVARLTTAGKLDSAFGTGGKVTTDFQGDDEPVSVLVQSTSSVLVAGRSERSAGSYAVIGKYKTI